MEEKIGVPKLKLVTRSLLLALVIGIVLLLVAIQTPSGSTEETIPSGSQASQIYFLQPITVSISISQLQGKATLLVQLMNYDSAPGSPIANVSVVAQDIVTFRVSSRGYYDVSFYYRNGSSPAVSYVIDESGVPPDLLVTGMILIALAGTLYVAAIFKTKGISRLVKTRSISTERSRQ